jgi:hypothetical protein
MTAEADLEVRPDAERRALVERWAERHGVDAARRLAEAEDLADAVAKEITGSGITVTPSDPAGRLPAGADEALVRWLRI